LLHVLSPAAFRFTIPCFSRDPTSPLIFTPSLHDALPIFVRFPPTATKEIQYLNAKGALTYTDIAGDPVLYGNLPPREIKVLNLRSEERFSRNAETDIVCRLLLEKKKYSATGVSVETYTVR